MQDADIEAKVGAQILRQGFQDPPVAAVTVDDDEIARRQRAGDLASEIAHESRHALDRQRHGAGRPFMLARKAYRQRWKLPKIQGLAPAGDDAVGKFLGQHDIGIERQVRAMLLDRTDRQAKYRALAENLRDFRESKLADQSTRASVWHGRYHICLRMIFSENRFLLFEIMREPCRNPRAVFATKIATLPISSCQRGHIPIRIRWVSERSHEMIEPVPGPSRFR